MISYELMLDPFVIRDTFRASLNSSISSLVLSNEKHSGTIFSLFSITSRTAQVSVSDLATQKKERNSKLTVSSSPEIGSFLWLLTS